MDQCGGTSRGRREIMMPQVETFRKAFPKSDDRIHYKTGDKWECPHVSKKGRESQQ